MSHLFRGICFQTLSLTVWLQSSTVSTIPVHWEYTVNCHMTTGNPPPEKKKRETFVSWWTISKNKPHTARSKEVNSYWFHAAHTCKSHHNIATSPFLVVSHMCIISVEDGECENVDKLLSCHLWEVKQMQQVAKKISFSGYNIFFTVHALQQVHLISPDSTWRFKPCSLQHIEKSA